MGSRRRTVADDGIELMYWGVRAFTAGPDAVLAERGLGRVHHRVLYCIGRSPGIRVGELADVLGVSRQALHRTLTELASRALIESERAEGNARERALTLTEEGSALEESLAKDQRKRLAAAERALGEDAMRGWREVMRFIARPGIEAVPAAFAHRVAHLLTPDEQAKGEASSGSRDVGKRPRKRR